MLGRVFLSEIEPELAASLEELVRTLFGVCLAHGQQPQISRLDFRGFENSLERIGIVPAKTIRIGHQAHRCRPLRVRKGSVSSNSAPLGAGHFSGFRNSNEQRGNVLADLECRLRISPVLPP